MCLLALQEFLQTRWSLRKTSEWLKYELQSRMWQWRSSSPASVTAEEFALALIVQHDATVFSKASHFSFSPLGKQSGLRTDSFSAPSPTITPTTEGFSPSSSALCRPPLTSFQHTLAAYLCIQDPVGPFPLSNTPSLPSFFLFVCFTVIISLAQKRVGVLAAVQKREAEKEKLHGNWVKVEYLLEEAIWRRNVCTKRACSLLVIVLLLLLPWLYLSRSLSHFLHFPLCPRENIQLQPHARRAFHIITALH